MPDLIDFLIIDDNRHDVGHLRAVLHMVVGYGIEVRSAASASTAIDAVKDRAPQVVFADHLSPGETAVSTMLKLRDVGYSGPIVVVTGLADPLKARQFMDAGAIDVVIKDDLDSARIAKTLAKVRLILDETSERS